MEGLGALGFWLMLGMVLAAGTVTRGLKERDKERESQALLRALLDKDGKTVTEVLAYLREKDEADRKLLRQLSGLDWRWPSGTRAVVMAILAFAGVFVSGWLAGAALGFWLRSGPVPFVVMFGIWAVAPVVAWWVWRSNRQKNVALRDA
jgi:hypothetical protein